MRTHTTTHGIKWAVCRHFGISKSEIESSRRCRRLARPRQIAMALCRELTTRSLPYIGKVYGNRDHTTVLHACRRIDELRKTDPLIDEDYCNIKWALSYSADECSWMQPTEWAASVFRDAA